MTLRRPYWCPKTIKQRPCWCPKPVLWELNSFLMQTLSFFPINLHRCWPREWKHSIALGNREEKSLRHVVRVAKNSGSQQVVHGPANKAGKTKKINMYDFVLVHDCTQEQNGSPCFSSIVRQYEWPSLSRKIVKIQKFATMVTWRHTSPLYRRR